MKLNNKGLTLAELIVSFMLVSVAIVYFFQTLITVNKLYQTAREETNEFIEKDYALRIADAWVDNTITTCESEEKTSDVVAGYYKYSYKCENNIMTLNITKKNESYVIATLYKYIK